MQGKVIDALGIFNYLLSGARNWPRTILVSALLIDAITWKLGRQHVDIEFLAQEVEQCVRATKVLSIRMKGDEQLATSIAPATSATLRPIVASKRGCLQVEARNVRLV